MCVYTYTHIQTHLHIRVVSYINVSKGVVHCLYERIQDSQIFMFHMLKKGKKCSSFFHLISTGKISVFVPCGYTQSLLFEVECSLCLFSTTLLDFIHKFHKVQLHLPEFAQDVQVLPYLPIWCLKDLVISCLNCSEVHTKLVARSMPVAPMLLTIWGADCLLRLFF